MYIKSYQCKRFAGLKDTNLEFSRGLNVILGPNESGKSTIVEGIYSTLFKDIKIRMNKKADKDFNFRFFPKNMGDVIDGRIVIETDKGSFELSKEWGSNENIELVTPNGDIFKDENDIKKIIDGILHFGESTYSNIIFARQRELKEALLNIIDNREVTREINDILRMALMELGGISIDSIQNKIEDELEGLYKRWDKEKGFPQNNRGISNPYKTGLGKILESYYDKEGLRLLKDEADRTEKEFEVISGDLKECKDRLAGLNSEKLQLEGIEEDVNEREILRLQIQTLNNELKALSTVNKEWPVADLLLKQMKDKIKKLNDQKIKLKEEERNFSRLKRKEILDKQLKSIGEIKERLATMDNELSQIPNITSEDIESLSGLEKEISTLETTMKAGKMLGKLKSNRDKPIHMAKGLGEMQLLEGDLEFEAGGFVKINYADEFQLEIKTIDVDLEEMKREYKTYKDRLIETLKALKIKDIEEGKLNLKEIESKKGDLLILDKEVKIILGDKTLEELKEELEELKEIKLYRDLEAVEEGLKEIDNELIEAASAIKNKEESINLWEKEYINQDKLLDIMLTKKSDLKEKEGKLKALKPLPERFKSVNNFKDRLSYLRGQVELKQADLSILNSNYYESKSKLLDESFEELRKRYMEAQNVFERNIERGEKLTKVYKAFLTTKEKMGKDPMKSLVNEFERLLSMVTDGRYKTGRIDEDFNLRLKNPQGEIPIELLSAGTYDGVTLALRFSLLKHIFKDRKGYLILDDCLVDLDPRRKAQAVALIREFAKEYQIIFTTCEPETASMLSDNIIEIE